MNHPSRETLIDRLIALIITWDEKRLNEFLEAIPVNPANFKDVYKKREYVIEIESSWAENTNSPQDIIDIYPEVLNKWI